MSGDIKTGVGPNDTPNKVRTDKMEKYLMERKITEMPIRFEFCKILVLALNSIMIAPTRS